MPRRGEKKLSAYPELVKQIHPTKNIGLDPGLIARGTKTKIWWICEHGHEWFAAILGRTARGRGCPVCAHQAAGHDNNITLFPHIMAFWHQTKNIGLSPINVAPQSMKVAWWQCEHGHEWQSSIQEAYNRSGCPFCLGMRPSESNNLLVHYPEVAKQWHPTKNGLLKPQDILPQSHQKVWWKCSMGHEWQANAQGRTKKGSGCPKCRLYGTSRFEIRVFSEIKSIWRDSLHKDKVYGDECDILIPCLKMVVEIDGFFWHKDSSARDTEKTARILANGYRVVRLRECPLPAITSNDITFPSSVYNDEAKMKECIKRLVLSIVSIFNVDVSGYLIKEQFANESLYQSMIASMPMPKDGESLRDIDPILAEQWHPTLNGGVTPDHVRHGSNIDAWWLCEKGHKWQAQPNNRKRDGDGCPFCSGQRFSVEHSLAVLRPQIASEWHPIKNGNRKPEEVRISSNERVWWRCHCGYEWTTTVKSRTAKNTKCPECNLRLRWGEPNAKRIANRKHRQAKKRRAS